MALAVCLSFVFHHFMKAMGEQRSSFLVSAACTVQCAMELKFFMEVYSYFILHNKRTIHIEIGPTAYKFS